MELAPKNTRTNQLNLLNLPRDNLLSILRMLDARELFQLKRNAICKQFNSLLSEPTLYTSILPLIDSRFPHLQTKPLGQKLDAAFNGTLDSLFLQSSKLKYCYYGAADFQVTRYVGHHEVQQPLTAFNVLQAMKLIDQFQSQHIKDLHQKDIPYPGYHPHTLNDEIHTTYKNNYMFDTDAEDENYVRLKEYVCENIVWFVLVHADSARRLVDLYAVGCSPFTHRLIGFKTQQVCHNLCD